MRSPLVSIVIPCFNAQNSLAEAIHSALQQTYQSREVIVIDDGSNDDSVTILKQFGSQVLWESGPNQGGCSARNRGVEIAHGEFVQFLDADDILAPEKLEKQVPVALEHEQSIVYCDHDLNTTDGQMIRRSRGVEWSDSVEFVLEHDALTTLGPLHRKSWLDEVGGFRVGLRAAQELDLHLRLAAHGFRFFHMPDALFTVRRTASSVSSSPAKTLEQWINFMPDVIEKIEMRGEMTAHRRAVIASHLARAGRQIVRDGTKDIGLSLLKLAHALDRNAAEHSAYSTPARCLKRIVGSVMLERLVKVWRRCNQRSVAKAV